MKLCCTEFTRVGGRAEIEQRLDFTPINFGRSYVMAAGICCFSALTRSCSQRGLHSADLSQTGLLSSQCRVRGVCQVSASWDVVDVWNVPLGSWVVFSSADLDSCVSIYTSNDVICIFTYAHIPRYSKQVLSNRSFQHERTCLISKYMQSETWLGGVWLMITISLTYLLPSWPFSKVSNVMWFWNKKSKSANQPWSDNQDT